VCNKDPEFYWDSKEFLKSLTLSPWHLSELASAIGTLELTSGSTKRARKLFRLALQEPTDNTIAQARWATGLDPGISVDPKHYNDPLSAEARAWNFFYAADWKAALSNFWAWHFDQPFSRRPCATGSYIAAEILGNHEDAIEMAQSGLNANPDNAALLNNMAFSLIHTGKLRKAAEYLTRSRGQAVPAEESIPLLATFGLWAFRAGYPQRGRELYLRAIERARAAGYRELLALAELHLAHEEYLANEPSAEQRLNQALIDASEANAPYVKVVESRIRAVFQQPLIQPGANIFTPKEPEALDLTNILPR
jgi:tetratricopeptide (TPR) repeat protein